MAQSYYSPSTGRIYSSSQLQSLFGVDVNTSDNSIVNLRGFYPIQDSSPDFDTQLYTPSFTWSFVPAYPDGEAAVRVYTSNPKPLPEAKQNGSQEAKAAANTALDQSVCNCGYSTDLLTAVASQDPMDRPTRFQAELDEMTAITNQLDADLAAIDAATSVDEIDSILKHPSGTIVTGRGGAGPDDMHPSYFTVLDNLPPGIGEPELEIYIPGTATVIPYDAELPEPYKFDSMGNCYNTGDYRTVIRVAATGQVLTTIYPAEGPAVPMEWTYNPNIPSYGGGSSSHSA